MIFHLNTAAYDDFCFYHQLVVRWGRSTWQYAQYLALNKNKTEQERFLAPQTLKLTGQVINLLENKLVVLAPEPYFQMMFPDSQTLFGYTGKQLWINTTRVQDCETIKHPWYRSKPSQTLDYEDSPAMANFEQHLFLFCQELQRADTNTVPTLSNTTVIDDPLYAQQRLAELFEQWPDIEKDFKPTIDGFQFQRQFEAIEKLAVDVAEMVRHLHGQYKRSFFKPLDVVDQNYQSMIDELQRFDIEQLEQTPLLQKMLAPFDLKKCLDQYEQFCEHSTHHILYFHHHVSCLLFNDFVKNFDKNNLPTNRTNSDFILPQTLWYHLADGMNFYANAALGVAHTREHAAFALASCETYLNGPQLNTPHQRRASLSTLPSDSKIVPFPKKP